MVSIYFSCYTHTNIDYNRVDMLSECQIGKTINYKNYIKRYWKTILICYSHKKNIKVCSKSKSTMIFVLIDSLYIKCYSTKTIFVLLFTLFYINGIDRVL